MSAYLDRAIEAAEKQSAWVARITTDLGPTPSAADARWLAGNRSEEEMRWSRVEEIRADESADPVVTAARREAALQMRVTQRVGVFAHQGPSAQRRLAVLLAQEHVSGRPFSVELARRTREALTAARITLPAVPA